MLRGVVTYLAEVKRLVSEGREEVLMTEMARCIHTVEEALGGIGQVTELERGL